MQTRKNTVTVNTFDLTGLTRHEMLTLHNALYLMNKPENKTDVCWETTENYIDGETQGEALERLEKQVSALFYS